MKKGEIQLSHIPIILLVITLIATGMFYFMSDIYANYPTELGTNYQNVYGRFNTSLEETYTLSKNIETKVDIATNSSNIISETLTIGSTMLSALKMVLNSFGIMWNMLNDITSTLGIPSFFITAFKGIVILIVIFALISLVLKWRA